MSVALWLVGCVDLPPGWQGASPVDELTQRPCDSDAEDRDGLEAASGGVDGDRVEVVYDPVTFRCAQDVEGFWRQAGGHVELLVQPRVMHPRVVAKCDCPYRVTVNVWAPGAQRFSAWRRWDAVGGASEPVLVGQGPL